MKNAVKRISFAKFRFDTAENEPAKNLQDFTKFANFARFANPNIPPRTCLISTALVAVPRGRPPEPLRLLQRALDDPQLVPADRLDGVEDGLEAGVRLAALRTCVGTE